MELDEKLEILEIASTYGKEVEKKLSPLETLDPARPVTFFSVGGGELGDLAVTAPKIRLGGPLGGIRTVAFDRYEGFPAQDSADFHEVFDMMNGDLLEEKIRKYVPDPHMPHAIYLEIEKADTRRVCQLGVDKGYNVMSTPYGPLICMDRHLTKLMFDKLNIPKIEWRYASNQNEIEEVARDFGLPIIVKPVMTSSGHGTTIVKKESELEDVYAHSIAHARGKGDEVIVERYLPELRTGGTEITQLVVRHFNGNGKIVTSFAPPVEHRRPAATYHESWMPAGISQKAKEKCVEGAGKIAGFIGGLGVFAVEQFVIGDMVYNNEVANRPHDTGMITRWMLNMDEGAMMLYSTIGLPITPFDLQLSRHGYGVAHVVLAPDFRYDRELSVAAVNTGAIKNYISKVGCRGDIWYFGKPSAYADRRMALAVGFAEEIDEARKTSEKIAHFSEKCVTYHESEL